jgi:hypothetical protein
MSSVESGGRFIHVAADAVGLAGRSFEYGVQP